LTSVRGGSFEKGIGASRVEDCEGESVSEEAIARWVEW